MTKQEEFLWASQTLLLSNSINMSLEPSTAIPRRHLISFTGITGFVEDALWASKRIPEDMSASEAASEFCGHWLEVDQEPGENPPVWCTRF